MKKAFRITMALLLVLVSSTACGTKDIAEDAATTTVDGVVYDDWFLPSSDELHLLYDTRTYIPGINTSQESYYWSSTEKNADQSMAYFFYTNAANPDEGGQIYADKAQQFAVRPIRAFD
ncbi:MAG: DUF1566 domain-containing protein [Oscillospiraceae bacterium]|jgi:hypothetical protein|nr:DUF1566 domain-containing protein [Oscillospiraceae bacterium]